MTTLSTPTAKTIITGLILAGGRSQRMGQDKALIKLKGRSLLQWSETRLAPQVDSLLISSNRPQALQAITHSPIIADDFLNLQLPPFSGPLAGILGALLWMQQFQPQQQWLLSVAVDTPQFPPSLADDLFKLASIESRKLVCAASADKLHPTCALWHTDLVVPLRDYLRAGERRLMGFHKAHEGGCVSYSTSPYDPFFNLNTAADLDQLERENSAFKD